MPNWGADILFENNYLFANKIPC